MLLACRAVNAEAYLLVSIWMALLQEVHNHVVFILHRQSRIGRASKLQNACRGNAAKATVLHGFWASLLSGQSWAW